MTLRTRLLVVVIVVGVALGIGCWLVVSSQSRFLLDQVDDDLEQTRPFIAEARVGAALPIFPPPPEIFVVDDGENPLSDIYLGLLGTDGELRTLSGIFADAGVPRLGSANIRSLGDAASHHPGGGRLWGVPDPFTVADSDGSGRFRVLATPAPDGSWVISARSLDEAEAAARRLAITLGGAALVVVATLALAAWWVIRLGLRPIKRITDTATAIAAGASETRVSSDRSSPEVAGLAAAFNEMLDQRDAADVRLRRFVADASHELRTPLTSIRGYLDLSIDGAFDEPMRADVLRRMRNESVRMQALIEDLLLLANLDEGRPLRRDPVKLTEIARDVVEDAMVLHPERSITVDNGGGEDGAAVGDELRLRQVIAGLVDNALTHTEATSSVRVVVAAHDKMVSVTVADEGPGMTPELADRVFDRFVRGDPSRSRTGGGSGLGLAIAASIVAAHHGTLTVESTLGVGTSFNVTLPRGS